MMRIVRNSIGIKCGSIAVSVFLFLCVGSSLTSASTPKQPNILLLMAEDMSDRVGAFGDKVAVTPNLDQLATESVRYPNTFTTAGVCAPSRAGHITGMHQISFGGQHMRTSTYPEGSYKAVPPPEVKAYPELLRAAGYYTYTTLKLDYQFSGGQSGSGPFTIWNDEGSNTHWRNREPGQPFYALVNLQVTHESGVFTPLGHWPNSFMHFVMQVMRAWVIDLPEVRDDVSPDSIVVPPYYPDTPTVRSDMARHYNNIAAMDRQVAEILAQLKEDGLEESTIVIWTTDHGDGLPRAKRELYDSGIKVPMIIRWPEAYRPEGVVPGSLDERLISFVDFAPTVLKLAGVESPEYLQGQDFSNPQGEVREYIFASRDRIDSVEDRQRAVRDHRYKYIRSWYPEQAGGHHLTYRDSMDMMLELWALLEAGSLNDEQLLWFSAPGEERLFDTWNDPFEMKDLAKDLAMAPVLARLRTALGDWQARVDDWSVEPEALMVERFNPGGKQPKTAAPDFVVEGDELLINNQQPYASIGYRVNGEGWQLYSRSINVTQGDMIEAKSVRYGWKESDTASITIE